MQLNRHAILAIACCLGAALLVGTLEWQRRSSPMPVAPAATKPSVLNVANAARLLKLVTWEFETTISAETVSDKWYGDAVASVRAPVRYQYGVDLARLRHQDVIFGSDGYLFIVPPPERIAVEVDLAKLEQSLKVSGARWKSQNQGQLDAARAKLAAVARQTALSPDDEKRLREVSREQLERHLANVIGGNGADGRVTVRFAD